MVEVTHNGYTVIVNVRLVVERLFNLRVSLVGPEENKTSAMILQLTLEACAKGPDSHNTRRVEICLVYGLGDHVEVYDGGDGGRMEIRMLLFGHLLTGEVLGQRR
jgi:hypothetical protein